MYDLRLKLRGPISGMDSKSALPNAEGFIDLMEPFDDLNRNGKWDDSEEFNDRKEIALNSLTNQAGATAEQNLNIKKRANKILGFG